MGEFLSEPAIHKLVVHVIDDGMNQIVLVELGIIFANPLLMVRNGKVASFPDDFECPGDRRGLSTAHRGSHAPDEVPVALVVRENIRVYGFGVHPDQV